MEKRPIGTPWNFRLITFLLVLGLVVFLLVQLFQSSTTSRVNAFSYSHFLDQVRAGKVAEVVIQGAKIEGVLKTGERFSTQGPPESSSAYNDLIALLEANGVAIQFQSSSGASWFLTLLGYILPAMEVRRRDYDLSVKPARPKEGRVQNVRPVRGS